MVSVSNLSDPTSFLRYLVHHPRRLWIRRALFQIHLWLGLLLSLYLILISLSGALLVYHDLLTRTTLPHTLHPFNRSHMASVPQVVAATQARFPSAQITSITIPSTHIPAFQVALTQGAKNWNAVADPATANVFSLSRSWVDIVYEFHLYLLLGSRHGMQWNGVGAIGLLSLAISGSLLWWRGLIGWTRGLRISWRHNWRRINYDLHHAIGIWTLLIITWWAFSGIYFAWYGPVSKLIGAVFPLSSAGESKPPVRVPQDHTASLQQLIDAAHSAVPDGRLTIIYNPGLTPGQDVTIWMYLGSPEDFSHADVVRFDPRSQTVQGVLHYGQNETFGDRLLWLMQPLHFGNLWGPVMRAIWCLLGISLAALTATGVLMYWNRFLRSRWLVLAYKRTKERL